MKRESYRTEFKRGEVWELAESGGPDSLALVLSSDVWNQREVNNNLFVPVEEYRPEMECGPFDVAFNLGPTAYLIRTEDLTPYRRSLFTEAPLLSLPDAVLNEVNQSLKDMLAFKGITGAPISFPRQGSVQHADLLIPGENPKPVVVISSLVFGRSLDYTKVIVCTIPSNSRHVYYYDVKISEDCGKVSCSTMLTIPMRNLELRPLPGKTNLNANEKTKVLEKAQKFLGIM